MADLDGVEIVGQETIPTDSNTAPLLPHPTHRASISSSSAAGNDALFSVTVSSLGAVMGATAASVVYAGASTGGEVVASTAGVTVQVVGTIAQAGATLVGGSAAGQAVNAATRLAAAATTHTLRTTSNATAGVAAAVVGASTALAVTAGAYATRAGARAVSHVARKAVEGAAEKYHSFRDRQTGLGDGEAWVGLEDQLDPSRSELVFLDEEDEEIQRREESPSESGAFGDPAPLLRRASATATAEAGVDSFAPSSLNSEPTIRHEASGDSDSEPDSSMYQSAVAPAMDLSQSVFLPRHRGFSLGKAASSKSTEAATLTQHAPPNSTSSSTQQEAAAPHTKPGEAVWVVVPQPALTRKMSDK